MPPEAFPVLRVAFEATGSGRWIMATMLERGLDRANGFCLDLALADDRVCGTLQATEARLAAGEVDVIDTDWLSLARCRRDGLAITAVAPYGAIFGGLVSRRGGPLRTLADLPGSRIGVIHANEKNWLLLRAVCRERHGFDAQDCCLRIDAGSKTRLRQLLQDGAIDAALLFWHQVPAVVADGAFCEICDLVDALQDLGERACPSTFFVLPDALLTDQPALVRGFCRAVATAIAELRRDASAWQRAAGLATHGLDALRAKWMARIGLPWQSGMVPDLARLAQRLAGQSLPPGTFATKFL